MTPIDPDVAKRSGDVCKKCRAAIVWATTSTGKAIPVDPEPIFGGNIELAVDNVGMFAAKVVRPAGDVEAYVAHFTSCSDPAAFRNAPVPAPADQVPDHAELLERRKAAGRKVLSFGKYAGEYLDDIAGTTRGRGYLEWLLSTGIRTPALKEAVEIVLGDRQ